VPANTITAISLHARHAELLPKALASKIDFSFFDRAIYSILIHDEYSPRNYKNMVSGNQYANNKELP
jgi:hypothetical protein